jgi:metal-responsive CopG/Arc/MetJ family transcriptional regulator
MKKEKISKANEPDDPEVVLVTENEHDDDRFVTVSFKISYELLMKLDAFAARQRLSRSDIIRYAIEELLKNEGVI